MVLGQTAVVLSLNALVAEIAKTDIPVLLVGESGTGKEVYARWLHRLSGHDETLLKKLNCASLGPEQLVGELQRMTEFAVTEGMGPLAAQLAGRPHQAAAETQDPFGVRVVRAANPRSLHSVEWLVLAAAAQS